MTLRLSLPVLAALASYGASPAPAAEDCPTATQTVQQASDQVDELKHRETSLRTQIQTASSSLAYPALVSLLEAQLATKQSLIAAWEIIAVTTRAHPTCWPPGMADTVGSGAARFAAETRRSLEEERSLDRRAPRSYRRGRPQDQQHSLCRAELTARILAEFGANQTTA